MLPEKKIGREPESPKETAALDVEKEDLETGKAAAVSPRQKAPVPQHAVWWVRGEGDPCLRYFGAELHHQRVELRGWSLEDLHQASGLSRSFLSELENDGSTPTEEVILELEAALGMTDGGLMQLVRRRWVNAVNEEVAEKGTSARLVEQVRAIRRALKRPALGLWLAGWLPDSCAVLGWELALVV